MYIREYVIMSTCISNGEDMDSSNIKLDDL